MTVTRNFVGDDLCFAEEKFYIPWFADNWSRPVMKMDGEANPSSPGTVSRLEILK